MNTLAFTKKGIAPNIHKLLRSAVENANYANSEKGADVEIDNLFVSRAVANEGPRMKRIRPAPMGRAYRYQRRMSHIEIALAEKARPQAAAEEAEVSAAPAAHKKAPTRKKPARKSPAKKAAGKKK